MGWAQLAFTIFFKLSIALSAKYKTNNDLAYAKSINFDWNERISVKISPKMTRKLEFRT